jgi:hypothetical protein
VADAAQRILPAAIAQGSIGIADVLNTHNFIMMDNYHTQRGQTDGLQTYSVDIGLFFLFGFNVMPTVLAENSSDDAAVAVIEHELGNQLRLPELYTSPCPLIEPGGNPAPDDCVGTWDIMADSFFRGIGFGAYERMLAGWLTPDATRLEQQSWSGTVTLSPLEHGNGDVLALILSTQSLLAPGAAKVPFPGPGVWTGYVVECRRTIGDDFRLPSGGVLVSYFDSTRGGNAPVVVARRVPNEVYSDAALQPGVTFSNARAGVRVTYSGDASNGSCIVSVNGTGGGTGTGGGGTGTGGGGGTPQPCGTPGARPCCSGPRCCGGISNPCPTGPHIQ